MQNDSLVRLTLLTRNARLVDTRKEQGFDQKELARLVGMPLKRLADIENLRIIPTDNEMDDLSCVLMKPVEELFPGVLTTSIKAGVFNKRKVELSERQVASIELHNIRLALPSPEIAEAEAIVDRDLLKVALREVLGTITPIEERVIRARFGLDDKRPMTCEELGSELHLTRERIRQIEAKALRKIRHPVRSRKLYPFSEGIIRE